MTLKIILILVIQVSGAGSGTLGVENIATLEMIAILVIQVSKDCGEAGGRALDVENITTLKTKVSMAAQFQRHRRYTGMQVTGMKRNEKST